MFKKAIYLFLLLLFLPLRVDAKIYNYTLLEKTRGAELIVLAKYGSIKDEKYELSSTMFPRFAEYRITEVWKGSYVEDAMLLDYKNTNDKYEPFICRPAVHPIPDELVIFFLEKDLAIFAGFQGKIVIVPGKVSLYSDAIEKFLKLDEFQGREKVLLTLKMVEDGNPHVRESMLRELHNIDKTAYGIEIAGLLNNKDVLVRRSAIKALDGTEDKRTRPFVLSALKDPDSKVREGATYVLRSLDGEGITSSLIEAFNDYDAMVRRGVILSLSHRNSKEAMPVYLKALDDEDPLVRASGINAFEWVQQPDVIPKILNAIHDKNERVRASAIRILYVYIRIGAIAPNAKVIDSVGIFLTDKDPHVRKQAAFLFAETSWKGYRSIISEQIVNNLIHIVESDNNDQVKSDAIMALGAIASPLATPILLKTLSDKQWNMRAAAADGLSNIGNKTIIPHLERALIKEKKQYVIKKLEHALERLTGIE